MSKESFEKYVEGVLKGLVDKPEALSVKVTEGEKTYLITVTLPEDNVGQIIGKRGVLRSALQTVFWAASGALTDRVRNVVIEFG